MSIFGKPILTGVGKGSASGAIASFSDGAKGLPLRSLVANIEPVQDLHGYDNPWPAGGGKNLLDYDTWLSAYKVSDNNFSGASNDIGGEKYYIPQELVGKKLTFSAYVDLSNVSTPTTYFTVAYVGGTAIGGNTVVHDTAGYSSVTFTPLATTDYVRFSWGSGSGTIKLKDLQIEVGASRTVFAPYSNICPISGWSAVNMRRTGKNLCSMELANIKAINISGTWSGDAYTYAGVTFTVNTDGGGNVVSISTSGTATNASFIKLNTDLALPEGTYILSGCPVNSVNATIQGLEGAPYDSGSGVTFTTISGDGIRIRIPNGENASGLTFYPMIRLSSVSDATYSPYSGNQYTIQLGQTVYGGTLDVINGVLTVDRAIVDLGTLEWTFVNPVFYVSMQNYTPKPKYKGKLVCSLYVNRIVSLTNPEDMSIYMANSQDTPILRVADSRYTDAAAFKQMLTDNNAQLVYELATPITIPLTATQISMLQGANNVWTDSGDVNVEYLKQTLIHVGSSVLI